MTVHVIGNIIAGRPLFYGERDWTVLETTKYMARKKVGAIPILDGGKLVGIFSERDLLTRIVIKGKDPTKVLVKDVMTKKPVVAKPHDDLKTCLKKMQKAGCRHLPVLEKNQVLGTVSLRELMAIDLEEKKEEIQGMSEYMFPSHPANE